MLSTTLPRIDCEVIRYIRHSGSKKDGPISKYQGFLIRKKKVMRALWFLKKYIQIIMKIV